MADGDQDSGPNPGGDPGPTGNGNVGGNIPPIGSGGGGNLPPWATGSGSGSASNVVNNTGPDPNISVNPDIFSMFQDLPDLIRAALLNGGLNPIFLNNPLIKRMLAGMTGGAMVEALARQGTGQSTNTNDIINSLGGQFSQPGGPGQDWWTRIAAMQTNPQIQTAFGGNPEFANQIASSLSMGNLGRQMFFAPYMENVTEQYMAHQADYIAGERTTLDLLRQIMGGDFDI